MKPWPGYDPRRVIYIYAPEYHRTTINVTNFYDEGDDYDITINENEIVEPDGPELATTPADMNVRPNEDLLDEEGAEAAPRDEWDLDEGETGTRPAEGKDVTLSVRGRDEDGDSASGKCEIDVEIKNSSGQKVDSEKKKGASCAQTFSFTGMKEGSYTAKVTVAAKTGTGAGTDSGASDYSGTDGTTRDAY